MWPMIVPAFDIEEMVDQVHDFSSQPNFLSGGMGVAATVEGEALVNPRRIGFGSEPFYIPIYWAED